MYCYYSAVECKLQSAMWITRYVEGGKGETGRQTAEKTDDLAMKGQQQQQQQKHNLNMCIMNKTAS